MAFRSDLRKGGGMGTTSKFPPLLGRVRPSLFTLFCCGLLGCLPPHKTLYFLHFGIQNTGQDAPPQNTGISRGAFHPTNHYLFFISVFSPSLYCILFLSLPLSLPLSLSLFLSRSLLLHLFVSRFWLDAHKCFRALVPLVASVRRVPLIPLVPYCAH